MIYKIYKYIYTALAITAAVYWPFIDDASNKNDAIIPKMPLLDNPQFKFYHPMPQINKPQSKSNCPTVIFYEVHSDPTPAKTIKELLPNFLKKGYKTFIFEEPSDFSSADENIAKLEFGLQYSQGQIMHESIKSTVSLLKEINKHKLNYVAMDLNKNEKVKTEMSSNSYQEKIEIRDTTMAKNIEKACAKFGSGQVVLVGLFHNGIEHKLKADGYSNVSSVYIVDHPPIYDPSLPGVRANNDRFLRDYHEEYIRMYGYNEVNIVNVYDHPEINLIESVLLGLEGKNDIT